MVSFNFNIVKNKYLEKDVPSNHGFNTNDLNRICVYLHYYNNEKIPFYVGQGTINRAFNFISRNKLWKEKVKNISKVKVYIYKIDISIEESINLEKELIANNLRINEGGVLLNNNDGHTAIGKIGKDNYFYDKHLYDKLNGNYNNKYNNNTLSIPVIQIDILGNIIKKWSSATEAEEKGKFQASCISGCCLGKRKIHNGFQWIFEKDYDKDKNYEFNPGKTNNRIYIAIAINIPSIIFILYGSKDLKNHGFIPKNVSQVINGNKKSHKGYKFYDFFKLDKTEKEKYVHLIDITTKI